MLKNCCSVIIKTYSLHFCLSIFSCVYFRMNIYLSIYLSFLICKLLRSFGQFVLIVFVIRLDWTIMDSVSPGIVWHQDSVSPSIVWHQPWGWWRYWPTQTSYLVAASIIWLKFMSKRIPWWSNIFIVNVWNILNQRYTSFDSK